MALIKRIAISNLLNVNGVDSSNWKPVIEYLVLDIKGQSTAINLINGGGKTTIADAVIGLLSRDPSLLGKTYKKFSHSKNSYWSHVQVEIIAPKRNLNQADLLSFAGEEVGGETYVFGMCGYKDNNSKTFYFFKGSLEDLPVGQKKNNVVTLISNADFRENKPTNWNVTREEWLEEIKKHFSQDLEQLVQFQKNGGGDKSANLFNFKKKRGDDLQAQEAAFFYEVLAPAVMANMRDDLGEDGEYTFEEQLLSSTHNLIKKKHDVDKRGKKFEAFKEAVKSLEPVEAALMNALQNRQKYDNHLSKIASEIAQIRAINIQHPLPGLPKTELPEGLLGELIQYFVIDIRNGDLRITDEGLSYLLNDSVVDINRKAERSHVKKQKSSQLVEIYCHLKRIYDGVGHKSAHYLIEDALKLIDISNKFTQGLNKEKAKQILFEAEAYFNENIDTNVFRKEARALTQVIEEKTIQLKNLLELEETLYDQVKDTEGQIKSRDANQASYNDLVNSGLFTQTELANPSETEIAVIQSLTDADTAQSEFTEKKARLTVSKPKWDEFYARFPDKTPSEVELEHAENKAKAEKDFGEFDVKVQAFRNQHNTDKINLGSAESNLNLEKAKRERFDELLEPVERYERIFVDTTPVGLDRRLLKEKADLMATIKKAISGIRLERPYLSVLMTFNQYYQITPGQWLQEIISERRELTLSASNLKSSLADLRRQETDLKNESISANEYVQSGLVKLAEAGLSFKSFHQVVMNEASIEVHEKESLLSSFSTLIFSPVFDTSQDALQAAEVLSAHDLTIPVFVHQELIDFISNEHSRISEINGLYIGVLAGISSRKVKCLLDPTLIQNELEYVQSQIALMDEVLRKNLERQKEISDDSETVQLARTAKIAMEQNSEQVIQNLKQQISDLWPKYVDVANKSRSSVIETIKAKQAFDKLGGQATLLEHDEKINGYQSQKEQLELKIAKEIHLLKHYEDTLSDLKKQVGDAFPQELQLLLETVKSFYQEGGPEFFANLEETQSKFKYELEQAKAREGYKYHLQKAQLFLDQKGNNQNIERRLAELKANYGEAKKNANALRKERDDLREKTLKELQSLAEQIGQLAYLAQSKFKAVRILEKDVGDDLLVEEGVQGDLISNVQSLYQAIKSEDREVLVEELIYRIQSTIEEFDFSTHVDTAKRYERGYRGAFETLKEKCRVSVSNAEFAPTEKARLESILKVTDGAPVPQQHAEQLLAFINKSRGTLEVERDRYYQIQQAFDVAFTNADKDLTNIVTQTANDLAILKRVMKTNHSKRHVVELHVDAEVASKEQIAKIVERVMLIVSTAIENRDRNMDNNVPVEDEKDYKNRLKKDISDSIYRDIFKNPSVKFVHSHIRTNGKKYSIGEDLSEGQKTAMSLVLTIKLAEFAIDREARKLAPTQASKAIKSSESLLIIDGLFSNMSDPELIASAMDGIEDTRGKFQLIGLIHNPMYQNSFDVFPVYLIGKRHSSSNNSGWLSIESKIDNATIGKEDSLEMADFAVKKA